MIIIVVAGRSKRRGIIMPVFLSLNVPSLEPFVPELVSKRRACHHGLNLFRAPGDLREGTLDVGNDRSAPVCLRELLEGKSGDHEVPKFRVCRGFLRKSGQGCNYGKECLLH